MDAPANHETHLLGLLQSGDVRQAAHVLVTQHADEVYGLCRAMLRDGTTAEDVSQDVFAKAFAALPRFRGDASVRTWILRITRNACIDHIRKTQREPFRSEDEPDAHPVEEPSIADLLSRRESITRGLDALEEGERALVVLRFGHGLGYPELADAFALKPGTVRMRVSRALAKMRAAADAPPPQKKRKLARRRAGAITEPVPSAPSRAEAPAAPPALGAPPAAPASPPPPAAPASPPPAAAPAPRATSGSEGAADDGSADRGAAMEMDELSLTEDDAELPLEADGEAFSSGAQPAGRAVPKARGGWFSWLGRLFARDRVIDRVPAAPETPPESVFSAPPPPALRDRLDRMAASVGKTAPP